MTRCTVHDIRGCTICLMNRVTDLEGRLRLYVERDLRGPEHIYSPPPRPCAPAGEQSCRSVLWTKLDQLVDKWHSVGEALRDPGKDEFEYEHGNGITECADELRELMNTEARRRGEQ